MVRPLPPPPCHCQCSVLWVFKAIATRIRGKSKQMLKSLKIELGTSHSESRALANRATTAPLEGTCISRLLLGRMSNISPLEITSLEVQASCYTPKAFDLHFYNHLHPDFGRVERHFNQNNWLPFHSIFDSVTCNEWILKHNGKIITVSTFPYHMLRKWFPWYLACLLEHKKAQFPATMAETNFKPKTSQHRHKKILI